MKRNGSKKTRREAHLILLVLMSFSATATGQPNDAKSPDVSLPNEDVPADISQPVLIIPPEETPLAPEATQFIRGMALLLLPDVYTDDDDWNKQKRVQSGLNIKLDGLRLDTSRRWKNVNHGAWQRIDATLLDPQNHFQMAISLLPRTEEGDPRYRVRASMRLRATGRHQLWSFGAKLYSMSADMIADVTVAADLRFESRVIETDDGNKLRVLPHIETASARVAGLSVRNVSHTKGGAVREFGKVVESIVQRSVKKKNQKLAAKVNGKILKKPERFEIPAGILAMTGGAPATKVAEE